MNPRNWLFRYATKQIWRPESVGSTVYLWEESKHKRQTISRNPKTQTEVVLTFSREWRAGRISAAIFLRLQKTVYLVKKIHQFFGVLLSRSLFT